MLLPGYLYDLTILRSTSAGLILDTGAQELLLPRTQAPKNAQPGDQVTVFLYLDRHGKLQATSVKPAAQVGEFACLKVTGQVPGGAFLDWGLDKDLFIPDREQVEPMMVGRRYLVRVCHDQEHRPIASARLDNYLLEENRDLRQGDPVDLILRMFTDLGAKVIVNQVYSGLLYRDDLHPGLKQGDRLTGYVAKIRPDGKLDISLHPAGTAGIDAAVAQLLKRLERDGFLPLTDQSPPELIRKQLGLSKKLFKKAVGGLYKDGKITLEQQGIRLKTVVTPPSAKIQDLTP